ncbi:kinase-like protein [Gigaspora margarita]|uniref:Kinase-like protein n=1 Tax=Gigaspora margarita TaxID=4874 RepID=A0A8H4B457_GIGMA|nr:kinase-like protein [Gigaspora margarita]
MEEWIEKAISDESINYIEYNKFINGELIDVGGSGTVFRYDWKDCALKIALKCLKADINLDETIIQEFINELKLLRKVCSHQNIIAFYGVTKDQNGVYNMVLQYANDGNLRDYLRLNFKRLQWTDKLHIAKEIVLGLMFLHNNKIVHRDLVSVFCVTCYIYI